ncbi:MAG: ATP-dependent helicase/nuclease subunit [Sphingomonadales bacterium]|jgi:ATP-dependent helicase/nuclease subunit A|nr:ATP-dependent helicase/nuclease subunit [Sphingomonadales bacterium]
MPRHLRPLALLEAEQLSASAPRDHAALSASAGTGKTHVLTARVLRLLLAGVDPSSILCLTFTKAGAAEMADRIHRRLAYWVRLKDPELAAELRALGEAFDPEARRGARRLFARVLDAAGGGLRIQTIHAFAQGLLAAFPAEAGLVPGFRPLEGREEQLLARQTLAEMLVRAEDGGEGGLIRDIQAISHRLGEGGAEAFVRRCARAPDAMTSLGPPELVEDRLRRAFDLPLGDIDEAIAGQCCDGIFDVDALRRIGLLNSQWATKSGLERSSLCEQWAAADPAGRAGLLEKLHSIWAKADGEIRSFAKGQAPQDEKYIELATAAFECCARLLSLRKLAALIACLAAGLRAGQVYAEAWTAAKRAHAVLDFDDLIRLAERLLLTPGMGEWVRFKLDQNTDHILVDEAQDTNAAQWNIVSALVEEYFAGQGAGRRHRTLFTVGDYKQAIFGFQGTDPSEFERARAYFQAKAKLVRQAAIDMNLPAREIPPDFLDLSVDRSFRSSPPILAAVDRLIADLGYEAFGLPREPNPHESHHRTRPGSVTLWLPHSDDMAATGEEAGEEGWVSETVRDYARRLAAQIGAWIRNPFMLGEGSKRRPVRPEDILVLVRRRGDLASLIVARLHAEGVPVAGVDRLALTAPLAVQDLLAAVRFAVQPLDDLNLGALLVSPLFGWTQDELFEASFRRETSLWRHIRGEKWRLQANPPLSSTTRDGLRQLLAMADYATPHAFLETILSRELRGRHKLLERLGNEARDPIEELLSSALDFEAGSAPSLQRFLDWFARGEVEIVRDPSAPLDAVRVMTVHGSKGLQSPVVILADACADPDRRGGGFGAAFASFTLPEGPEIPIFRPRKEELAEPLAAQLAASDRREREEHWRLLYVALTRAEERLYIGGALGPADRRGPALASWWSALDNSLVGLGAEWEEDSHWGRALRVGDPEFFTKAAARPAVADNPLPDWIRRIAPVEARPPRPLAPSSLGEDDVADPPPSPAMRAAAQRGRLLHQLFERLPEVPREDRSAAAERWLERSAGVDDPELRRGLVEDVCRLIADPAHAELFGPGALAEAPIAAVVQEGVVVSGSVDRLLVGPDRILVADFKTGRRTPETLDDIPVPHLRQMAAYVEALKVIFPGRPIIAKLLYTAAPILFDLPEALLDRYRPVLEPASPAP